MIIDCDIENPNKNFQTAIHHKTFYHMQKSNQIDFFAINIDFFAKYFCCDVDFILLTYPRYSLYYYLLVDL